MINNIELVHNFNKCTVKQEHMTAHDGMDVINIYSS